MEATEAMASTVLVLALVPLTDAPIEYSDKYKCLLLRKSYLAPTRMTFQA